MTSSLICTWGSALATGGSAVVAPPSSTIRPTAVLNEPGGPLLAASRMGDLPLRADGVPVDDGEGGLGLDDLGASLLLASRMTASSLAWDDMHIRGPGAAAMHIRVNSVSGEGGSGGGSNRGKAYMIAGGAAFVGGLIIGDTAGTLIAVGGLGLGVYGAILYF